MPSGGPIENEKGYGYGLYKGLWNKIQLNADQRCREFIEDFKKSMASNADSDW
jgi:hypothetical protein